MNNDTTDIILEGSRFWFQKVLVPIMVVVGITGNIITVKVLTRKRMRSSTNIYLSALGIADIIYLFFVFLLSFKHYNNIHDRKYELFWRFYGISHWLCDAASSTSVWLTVSFTIERYIAVCHPMKGKYFCTENRAKTIIVIVCIFCLLTTATTSFEYQLTRNDTEVCFKCQTNSSKITSGNKTSTDSSAKSVHLISANSSLIYPSGAGGKPYVVYPNLTEALKSVIGNCTGNHPHIIYVYQGPQKILEIPSDKIRSVNNRALYSEIDGTLEKALPQVGEDEDKNSTESNSTNAELGKCCVTKWYVDVENTDFGKNGDYTSFMYWYSALVWGIVPLVLIATFNCFLINAVYMSQKKRSTMTRTNTQSSQTEGCSSISNENRITIMLIAVVVMFLICQTPTASYLIYYNFYPALTKTQKNIQSILGNVFNSLLTVNAACNFVFYSLMSKKFRTTFKEIFFDRKAKRRGQDTLQMSSLKSHSNSQKFNPYHHGINKNASEYRTPRNLEVNIYFFNKGKYVNTYRVRIGLGDSFDVRAADVIVLDREFN
ncbi:sex peptide receptor isoform X1 [Euwallacea similis]|uniref:sex peptide receptor isoform X1 n=1 Tax=Euwallacea similis TaxID=1736056 RepID=UPI00344F6409